jgi:gluconolactonase
LIKPDLTTQVLTNSYQGRKFNSPNDLVQKSDGTIWFTDPDYGLVAAYGDKATEHRELDKFHIFRYDPATQETVSVHDGLSKPNGLVFSKDEKQLFVGNSAEGDRRHVVFEVQPDNSLSTPQTLSTIDSKTWGIDGLKMDTNGLLYGACGDGVNVFTRAGKLIGKIPTAFEMTNLCFGGNDGKALFMTGHEGLFSIQLNINTR